MFKRKKYGQSIVSLNFQEHCLEHFYHDDGFCDDELNNSECEFDGGDCCLNDSSFDEYCDLCQCLE